MWISTTILTCIVALSTVAHADSSRTSKDKIAGERGFPYTCDALTPDLCDLDVEQGSIKVRNLTLTYWIYTDKNVSHAEENRHPLITVHGGPAYTHNYMLPLKQLACRGRKVIFYDQVGCGRSDRATKAHAPWLYTIDYYREELKALIAHFGFKNYHILGSSWGTIVGQLFAEEHPVGLRTLTLSGPLSNAKQYIDAQWDSAEGNLGSLPDFMQERLRDIEKRKQFSSEEYKKISDFLTTKFTLLQYPAPDCFIDTENGANLDIYTTMQGPSEFAISGVMADMDITDTLHKISVPTLLTSGQFDTMRPPILRDILAHLINGVWINIPRSGHISMIDNPKVLNDEVDRFIQSEEDGRPFTSEHSLSFVKESAGKRSWTFLLAGTLAIGVAVGYLVGVRSSRSDGRPRTPVGQREAHLLAVNDDCE